MPSMSYGTGGQARKRGRPKISEYLPERWTKMRRHDEQARYWASSARFKVVPAGRRSGKCLAEGSMITMADGTWKPIELVSSGDMVLSVNFDNYQMEPKPVKHTLSNGKHQTIRITTRSRTITCTLNHPFLIDNKWVEAKDIKPGQLIGVIHHVDIFGDLEWDQDELDYLAIWLAEGPKGGGKTGLETTHKARLFLESLGLWGKNSKTKFIPDFVFRLKKPQLARFLNLFMCCDGHFHNLKGSPGFSIGLANEVMILQLARLFSKFGIRGRIKHKVSKKLNKEGMPFESWNFSTTDPKSVTIFCSEIGMVTKPDKIKEAFCRSSISNGSFNAEFLPIKYDDLLPILDYPHQDCVVRDSSGRFVSGLGSYNKTIKDAPSDLLNILKPLRRNRNSYITPYRFKKIQGYASYFDQLLEGVVNWEVVKKVENGPVCQTYDLTVEDNHNFLVENTVTHNTELSKRKMILRALAPWDDDLLPRPVPKWVTEPRFFFGAPVWQQAKRIFWSDLKTLIPDWAIDRTTGGGLKNGISESDLRIRLVSGAEIWVIGMDKPERIEGTPWDGCVLDEYGNMKARTWPEHVRPALSDRQGWCDFIGVPEGRNHYFDLAEMAKRVAEEAFLKGEEPEWDHFHWYSADILPKHEIESARKDLDELTFRQEYQGCHDPETLVQLWGGANKKISEVLPGDLLVSFQGERVPTKVILSSSTKIKHMMTVELEDGTRFRASTCHKMKVGNQKVELSECEFLEIVPTYLRPKTQEEALAAIVGFNLGDGTVTKKYDQIQKDGTLLKRQSTNRITHGGAAFYSSDRKALEELREDLKLAGIDTTARVTTKSHNFYQLQIGSVHAKALVEAGCVVGHKPSVDFGVPKWIKSSSNNVKRCFLAALFGAEGSTPRGKKNPETGIGMYSKRLVKECGDLLKSFDIETTFFGENKQANLYIKDVPKFYSEVGFLYANRKQELAWLWNRYLFAAGYKKRKACELYELGYRSKKIGEMLKINPQMAKKFATKEITKRISSAFPTFSQWKTDHYSNGKLRLEIIDRQYEAKQQCWNVVVDSPDHSYLLANGIDNFNSFEFFAGRVYYPFDEKIHCRSLRYDPEQPLIFCFDFNISPGVCAICQEQQLPGITEEVYDERRNETYFNPVIGTGVIGEVFIPRNSNTVAVCNKLIQDWGNHKGDIHIYGDATGGAGGSAQTEGSDWDIVRKMFRSVWKRTYYFIPTVNPRERARINAVNSRLMSTAGLIRLLVDREKCPNVAKDLSGTRLLEGGGGEIDKKADPMLSHISDACGYYISYRFPVEEMVGRSIELLW